MLESVVKRYNKITNLFLAQTYEDSWVDYQRSLRKTSFIRWDYVFLTASNEAQAQAFRVQIQSRIEKNLLPKSTKYVVLPDPNGKRVGSGGATFNVLKYIGEQEGINPFEGKRILVIHSGGDSKRIPQYSAVGKLFSPVPRELPDGRGSTLFDEFIIGMSGVPSRIKEGMLVLSGDVLLLFNPLQIDAQFNGAAAISIKEPVETGKNHGVFLNDGNGYVKNFLHKQTEEGLRKIGAVNEHNTVDLDTGAILLNTGLLEALYGLISTNGKPDVDKFDEFVNERARISFYGDFLYPLASDSTLDQYYLEKPEGEYTEELRSCRTKLWNAISGFDMKLICLSPARFIHFGTTTELQKLLTKEMSDYEFLDWKAKVLSNQGIDNHYAAYGSYVGRRATVHSDVYLENSFVLEESQIGERSIISHLKLRNISVPAEVVLHWLPLKDEQHVVRIFGVQDNPKGSLNEEAAFMQVTLKQLVEEKGFTVDDLWEEGQPYDLWNAKLYPVCATQEEAIDWALKLYKLTCNIDESERCILLDAWRQKERMSLCRSFNEADVEAVLAWENDLENRILSRSFIDRLQEGIFYEEALKVFGRKGITTEIYHMLLDDAEKVEFGLKIRIYYAVSRYLKTHSISYDGYGYDYSEGLCFRTIQEVIYDEVIKKLPSSKDYAIAKEQVNVQLPVRVNWGGGWTDTPPYCNEKGGVVLNAAISLNGILPVQIMVKRLDEYHIEFESQDIGVQGCVHSIEEVQDCHNPYDPFALHKAALIACGIIPLRGSDETLEQMLARMGGGIYLSTQVVGIPKGSGLGTSSILAGACVKGLFDFMGVNKSDADIYEVVLCMEQIMSTGGGWQDQVGGLTNGIKLISSAPGLVQKLDVSQVKVPKAAMQELSERFALIYTGQRRLARNLLRDVVGGYIGARPESLKALEEMKPVAALMAFYLQHGDIDAFANLLNKHWELSKQLDRGSTNNCIDQIFMACEDLIDARFISGAGGGGFIMVILKKGITKEMLRSRLTAIFQDSGVDVWDCAFV